MNINPNLNNNLFNPSNNSDSSDHSTDQDLEDLQNNFVISPDSHNLLSISQYYSEEARRDRRWDQRERDRFEFEQLERRNIRELSTGYNHFLGLEPAHPVSEDHRFQAERDFPSNPEEYFRNHYPQDPVISTTITLYPDSFPVFVFSNPRSGHRSSAYPSARDIRLDRESRIILQALEVSLTDPSNSYWEDFYQE